MCGGTFTKPRTRIIDTGLSPRVRGNRSISSSRTSSNGSIPACAGEPSRTRCRPLWRSVYPRVCGGTTVEKRFPIREAGLSPRVRGNRRPAETAWQYPRSIPACAGEPRAPCPSSRGAPVYPRVCGGTLAWPDEPHLDKGLSPRVRGNPEDPSIELLPHGSIPACAGEPPGRHRPGREDPVYPRVCGGTYGGADAVEKTDGLSPRVRGNQWRWISTGTPTRSIPACAGEPQLLCRHTLTPAVYPRVCGGTVPCWVVSKTFQGLSPRVRGNHRDEMIQIVQRGSIPACAGEPAGVCAPICSSPVYPRVCGGT